MKKIVIIVAFLLLSFVEGNAQNTRLIHLEMGKNFELKNRMDILIKELSKSKDPVYRGKKEEFITRVKAAFGDPAYFDPTENKFRVNRYIEMFFYQFNEYGLEFNDLVAFASYFKKSKYPEMRNWAIQKLNVYGLINKPLELKHYTIDGKDIDLKKLRGKVVLIDFWSNTCSICIERMPSIKAVYDKYKDNGFVVISSAFNPEMDKDKILAIHHRIGADWPVIILGGNGKRTGVMTSNSIGQKIREKYGFSYVPQLLLLDKHGKLAMYNGVLMKGDIEPLVKELLAK